MSVGERRQVKCTFVIWKPAAHGVLTGATHGNFKFMLQKDGYRNGRVTAQHNNDRKDSKNQY